MRGASRQLWRLIAPAIALLLVASCGGAPQEAGGPVGSTPPPLPTTAPIFTQPSQTLIPSLTPTPVSAVGGPLATPTTNASIPTLPASPVPAAPTGGAALAAQPGDTLITVDATQNRRPISPLIYGLSGAPPEVLKALRPGLNSWGGNTATRYNWRLGNAWNAAADYFYMNTDYDYKGKSASDDFLRDTAASKAAARLALPTLGWVAKNTDRSTCSFPKADGSCGDADRANCANPGAQADPTRTSVRSDVADIVEWVKDIRAKQLPVRFYAMDNEPDIWGVTHYDLHPTCTSYQEILDQYTRYASAVRAAAPDAELLGPVSCCWYFYWNSGVGGADKALHGGQDFLPWFLAEVRKQDQASGVRTLDVLDVHYYPEGLYNEDVSPAKAAQRLRATRSLWDQSYVDESWINEPVRLIPRLREVIDQHYPGTKLGITEWNFGADKTANGALAIADVLGIFGREGVYLASYWRYPELGSPGAFAFQLYTNYTGNGDHFADTSVLTRSAATDRVAAHAAVDSQTGRTTVMLINTGAAQDAVAALDLRGITARGKATLYRYGPAAPDRIVAEPQTGPPARVLLPAESMALLVIEP